MIKDLPAGKAGNKFSKYLLYAIGEIFLVVIGILIALQLNTWNEHVKNRAQEDQILRQLKEEYQENLLELKAKMAMRKEMLTACTRLLNYYETPNSWTLADSVAVDFTKTTYTPTFNPVVGVTNELLASGKLYLIEHENLKPMLTNWTGISTRLIEYEEDLRNMTENEYAPYLRENYSYRSLFNGLWSWEVLNAKRKDKSELIKGFMNDENLEDYIISVASAVLITENEATIVQKHIEGILEIITTELHTKND